MRLDRDNYSGHKLCPEWAGWDGSPLPGLYGTKPLIAWQGIPVFAEIAILKSMEEDGWQGVWVDSFRRKYLRDMSDQINSIPLPPEIDEQLGLIRSCYRKIADRYPDLKISKGEFGGCWDILCWKGDRTKFLEAKRRKKDRLQRNQAAWLMAALGCGYSIRDFRVVEWTMN